MGKGGERLAVVPNTKTAVWWDINSCRIPKGYDPHRVRRCIDSVLNKSGVVVDEHVSIVAVGNLLLLAPDDRKALSSSGIVMRHTDFDSSMCVWQVLSDWQCHNLPPATVMVISNDPYADLYFHKSLLRGPGALDEREVLEERYTVIPAYPLTAGKSWRWKAILKEAPPLKSPSDLLDHKCAGSPLWICTECPFETDTYDEFATHLYGTAHEELLYDLTHFPPTDREIYFQFKRNKDLFPLEDLSLPDIEQVSISNLAAGPSEFPEKDASLAARKQQSEETQKEQNEEEKEVVDLLTEDIKRLNTS
ncbi:hypothetical protein AALP_AA3G361900 [Arabis alpina]|uniref:NYN domain-containing protein n=1 Tax=Arabis alpina TaxID=50452 RepID=A0A087HDZ2_ARAAL|nr:hypothetical protein AALP_AA3G361900 [Arabis alpina]